MLAVALTFPPELGFDLLTGEVLEFVAINLFRELPRPKVRVSTSDDEPSLDLAWPHLQARRPSTNTSTRQHTTQPFIFYPLLTLVTLC